jgi:hypothetical protein
MGDVPAKAAVNADAAATDDNGSEGRSDKGGVARETLV